MLKSVTVIMAGEFVSVGNEFVTIDSVSIPIDAIIEMAIAPLGEE